VPPPISSADSAARAAAPPPHRATALFGHRPFLLYFGARGLSEFASQIGTVAIGWQVYALTGSAWDLGLVGLAQFIPSAVLVFAAGHVADRYDRRRVLQACQVTAGITAALLAWGSFGGRLTVVELFAAVAVLGAAGGFESPAMAALLAGVVPEDTLQGGAALSSAAMQAAMIGGPALGGLAYALSPGAPYAAMAVFWTLAGLMNGAIALARPVSAPERPTWTRLFAGVRFVRGNPAILGTISLDLFAVLLGGATALMPIYARDILHTGPWGLGVLRGAPALGALLMSAVLARHAIQRRAGMRMFQAVIAFGLATLIFALSHRLWLSIAALAVLGAADMVSMVIRASLVQLATPDEMRGRVGAVNFLFINASGQLGEFESGTAAALLGPVPAAVLGGLGSIAVALLWMWWFPSLRRLERLE
jgi:MFS family permease